MTFSRDTILVTVSPDAERRCRRLEHAILLLSSGTAADDARRIVRERWSVSQPTAWRIVAMAEDLVRG